MMAFAHAFLYLASEYAQQPLVDCPAPWPSAVIG